MIKVKLDANFLSDEYSALHLFKRVVEELAATGKRSCIVETSIGSKVMHFRLTHLPEGTSRPRAALDDATRRE